MNCLFIFVSSRTRTCAHFNRKCEAVLRHAISFFGFFFLSSSNQLYSCIRYFPAIISKQSSVLTHSHSHQVSNRKLNLSKQQNTSNNFKLFLFIMKVKRAQGFAAAAPHTHIPQLMMEVTGFIFCACSYAYVGQLRRVKLQQNHSLYHMGDVFMLAN